MELAKNSHIILDPAGAHLVQAEWMKHFESMWSPNCGEFSVENIMLWYIVWLSPVLTSWNRRRERARTWHISLRLLYCTINLTSRYNINRDKFAILNKLFNTKETFFNCVVGCLLVYSLLLWKYIINLVIEHCQNIFAN